MIRLVKARDVDDSVIYQVFKKGYSDYSISLDMGQEAFVHRFLEIDASRDLSYLAFDKDQPAGLILGKIQNFHGVKTMRCGGFAVIPQMRKKGIGEKLFEKHEQVAKENNCKLLFLEVLKENDKAIRFYKRVGYHPVNDFRYYKLSNPKPILNHNLRMEKTDFKSVHDLRSTMPSLYLNWQGEFFSLEAMSNVNYYSFYEENQHIGLASVNDSGTIYFIWVDPRHRQNGYGQSIIAHIQNQHDFESMGTISCNNILYEGFLRKIGMTVEIEQHEMMKVL
ncbi:GNAT family N-acetyltransferase [Fusibacter sp. JL216-2]|uniref:GNAT family N-acetyltransferase n=1 Tax=Fusibacter sp. JL216-2 TaxID=3071453 RepID=UPI003D32632A